MTSVAYEQDSDRISYDEVEKEALVSYVDEKFSVSNEMLDFLPDFFPKDVARLALSFLLHPISVELVPGEHLAFWDAGLLDDLGLVALDVTLHPPQEAYAKYGIKCFYKGSFDNNFYTTNGGIYAVADTNITFVPAWRDSVAGSSYVCASDTELVSDLHFVF